MSPEMRKGVPPEEMQKYIDFIKQRNQSQGGAKASWYQDPFAGFTPMQTEEEYRASGARSGTYTRTSAAEQKQAYMKNPQYQYIDAMNRANEANEKRYNEMLSLYGKGEGAGGQSTGGAAGTYDDLIRMFGKDSEYGEGAMSLYERAKKQSVGAAGQKAMSGGTYNTTDVKALGKQFDVNVGTTYLANINDMRMRMLMNAMTGKAGVQERGTSQLAGIMERRQDAQPDMNLYANLMRLGSRAPSPMMNFRMGGMNTIGEQVPNQQKYKLPRTGGWFANNRQPSRFRY